MTSGRGGGDTQASLFKIFEFKYVYVLLIFGSWSYIIKEDYNARVEWCSSFFDFGCMGEQGGAVGSIP